MKIPKLDKEFMESVRKIQSEMTRQRRVAYIKEHAFDIFNLIISLIALIVAILGLYLPQSNEPAYLSPSPEGQYQAEDKAQGVAGQR